MVTWFPFRGFGCPVSRCQGGNACKSSISNCRQQGSYNWVCNVCGTPMFISDSGYLSCKYGYHNDHICNWRFDCGNHGNHPVRRYSYADYQGFSYSLSQSVGFMDSAGATWISGLVLSLGQQYGRQGPRRQGRKSDYTTNDRPGYQQDFRNQRSYRRDYGDRYRTTPYRHPYWCECLECMIDDIDLC